MTLKTSEEKENGAISPLETGPDDVEEITDQADKKKKIQRILIAIFLLSLIIFVIVDSFTNQFTRQLTQDFLKWVEQNPTAGVFAFMGVYIIATGTSVFQN